MDMTRLEMTWESLDWRRPQLVVGVVGADAGPSGLPAQGTTSSLLRPYYTTQFSMFNFQFLFLPLNNAQHSAFHSPPPILHHSYAP